MSDRAQSDTDLRVRIRPARDADAPRLREIAAASKGHWGYDPERVRAWAARLELAPPPGHEVVVAEAADGPVAFAVLVPRGAACVLDDLWVAPEAMRRGVGSRLLDHAVERARELGAKRVEWESEPNAVGFYEKAGARFTGETSLSSWGRELPVMALDVRDERPSRAGR